MAVPYDQYDYESYWDKRQYEHISEIIAIKAFLQKIPDITRIAEIGAGFGRLTPYYSFRAKNIYLVDPSSKILKLASEKIGVSRRNHFVHASLATFPEKTKGKLFDMIIMVRVMHHLDDPNKAIEILSSKLNDSGFLIIEFANKIHWKAVLLNTLHGNFKFVSDINSVDRRSQKMKNLDSIQFLNHHPRIILTALKENGFKVLETRSVSNFRSVLIKKHISPEILLEFERICQIPLGKIFFGPSIFILAQKTSKA